MTQYITTYGTLKHGHERHDLIEPVTQFRSQVFLPGKLLNYKNMFPVWSLEGADAVVAELYEITGDKDELFEILDEVEGHPFLFRRDTFEIQVPVNQDLDDDAFHEDDFVWLVTTAYVGAAPSLLKSPRIPGGSWPLDKGLLE